MGNTGADKYEITAREIHENQFSTFLGKLEDDLWESDSWGLDSERKKVLASSPGALACTLMDLGVFGSVGTHFPSEKLILPYFSSPSMVAVSVPFPEVRNRKGTESGLKVTKRRMAMGASSWQGAHTCASPLLGIASAP